MTKKKQKKSKLGALILLLFLTIVMLSTATYAWFTANKSVQVSNIDVNVQATGGIQISTDAVNWKTLISNADITTGWSATVSGNTVNDTNQLPTSLSPVSTAGLVDASTDATAKTKKGNLSMYHGVVAANTQGVFSLTAEKDLEVKGTEGNFIAFDLFIKTDAAAALYIEPGTGASVTAGSTDKGLQNATRIAFVIEGNAGANDATAGILTLDNATSSNVTIFEPHVDSHTASGVTQSNLYYSHYTNYNTITAASGNQAVSCDGVKAPITSAIPLAQTNATDNASYFQTVTSVPFTSAFANADTGQTNYEWYSTTAPFPAGITKVRVYMWVEGQDVDCENDASGANLTYKIALTQNA